MSTGWKPLSKWICAALNVWWRSHLHTWSHSLPFPVCPPGVLAHSPEPCHLTGFPHCLPHHALSWYSIKELHGQSWHSPDRSLFLLHSNQHTSCCLWVNYMKRCIWCWTQWEHWPPAVSEGKAGKLPGERKALLILILDFSRLFHVSCHTVKLQMCVIPLLKIIHKTQGGGGDNVLPLTVDLLLSVKRGW